MAYEIEFTRLDDILQVTATGTRSIDAVLSIVEDIFTACTEQKINIVLIDVRGLDGRLSTLNTFKLATRHFPILRELRVIKKAAIVDLVEFEHNYRFFENLTKKRGYRLRLFSDHNTAMTWLES